MKSKPQTTKGRLIAPDVIHLSDFRDPISLQVGGDKEKINPEQAEKIDLNQKQINKESKAANEIEDQENKPFLKKMFNYFRRSATGQDDTYPRNQEYGKHIDIKYTGQMPGEQIWEESKQLSNQSLIDESHQFHAQKTHSYDRIQLTSEPTANPGPLMEQQERIYDEGKVE
ncbi:UNKNOWN [Stylonychia lemnae]|uniref:Uncharacterized protein n=1 Tax=Stylonychia lemnae TaxID=5949 RepID=A0A078AN37_STYLE|nr:UNKNOWN [Stylonychia lemnae]|eukprot:CDW82318.1 UNKNOWN [Stylonychia lemnae]